MPKVNRPVRPSSEEISYVADVLSRLPAGFLPEPIFNAVARLVALSNVEVVPLIKNPLKNELFVLMIKRAAEDKYWPNMWHTPGAIILATDRRDSLYHDALDRVINGELQKPKLKGTPVWFADTASDTFRGRVLEHRFWVELESSDVGQLFNVDDLPPLFPGQAEIIEQAVSHFNNYKKRP